MSVASPYRSEQVKEGGGESGLGGDCLDEAGAAAEPGDGESSGDVGGCAGGKGATGGMPTTARNTGSHCVG